MIVRLKEELSQAERSLEERTPGHASSSPGVRNSFKDFFLKKKSYIIINLIHNHQLEL